MAAITFDTRKAVRNLKAVGFEEPQADAIVDTLGDAFTDTVATKADIAEVKADIAEVKVGVKADIAEVKADIVGVKAELKAMATQADVAGLKAYMLKVAVAAAVGIILANATMTLALIRFLS